MSVAESAIAVWIFALLTLLVFAATQSATHVMERALTHETEMMVGEGSLQRDARLLAQGKAMPGLTMMSVDGQRFTIAAQTVWQATYLRELIVTVQTADGVQPLTLSFSRLQAVSYQ